MGKQTINTILDKKLVTSSDDNLITDNEMLVKKESKNKVGLYIKNNGKLKKVSAGDKPFYAPTYIYMKCYLRYNKELHDLALSKDVTDAIDHNTGFTLNENAKYLINLKVIPQELDNIKEMGGSYRFVKVFINRVHVQNSSKTYSMMLNDYIINSIDRVTLNVMLVVQFSKSTINSNDSSLVKCRLLRPGEKFHLANYGNINPLYVYDRLSKSKSNKLKSFYLGKGLNPLCVLYAKSKKLPTQAVPHTVDASYTDLVHIYSKINNLYRLYRIKY
jgi:hypothetical protein